MDFLKRYLLAIVILIAAFSSGQTTILCGTVMDRYSHQVLADANITLMHSQRGTTSNAQGHFQLTFYTIDTLVITYMGYHAFSKIILPGEQDTLELICKLEPKVLSMPGVQVVADHDRWGHAFIPFEPSARSINTAFFQQTAMSTLPDLYTALRTLPSLNTASDASPQVAVRGGQFDQNLVLLDGAVIYYPFHYLGTVSVIPLSLIESVEVYPGGFSAAYGDRLSSVISIKTSHPKKQFSLTGDLNINGSTLQSAGYVTERIGWLVSGRTSFRNLNRYFQDDYSFRFWDVYAKVFYHSHKHRFDFFMFQNFDQQKFEQPVANALDSDQDESQLAFDTSFTRALQFENRLISGSIKSFWHQRLYTHFQWYQSEIETDFNVGYQAEFPDHIAPQFQTSLDEWKEYLEFENRNLQQDTDTRFRDLTLRFSLDHHINHVIHYSTGLEWSRYNAQYAWKKREPLWEPYVRLFFDHAPTSAFQYHKPASKEAIFLENRSVFGDMFRLRTGIRATHWRQAGPAQLEPRVSLEIYPKSELCLSLVAGRYTQGLFTSLEEGLVGFLPLHFPAQSAAHFSHAWHWIAGFRWSRGDLFSLALTGYYKSYQNLSRSITDDPLFISGSGHSRGLETEASAKGYGMLFRGFYTLTKSDRRFGHLTYPANTDIRHKIAGQIQRKIGRLQVSAYGEFHTGQPYNPGRVLAAIETLHPRWDNEREKYDTAWGVRIVELDVPRDKMRYPPYHRLDVHIRLPLFFKGRDLCPYISIQNLYNRKNVVYFLDSSVDYRSNGYTFGQTRIVSGRIITAGIEVEW